MIKKWYLDNYQPIIYAIQVARSEYDKFGSFISPTFIILTALKLYFPFISWWVLPISFFIATFTAYWSGLWLIKIGVPKKTAELGNKQNPQMMEILERLERIETNK